MLRWPRRRSGPASFDLVDLALEATAGSPGCVICSALHRATERSFDALLWELVTDPAVRGRLRRSLGFCPRHTWELVRVERKITRNVLGLAILFEDLARSVSALLEGPQPERSLRARPPCPACHDEQEAEAVYLERFVQRTRNGETDRSLLSNGGALCPRHGAAAAFLDAHPPFPDRLATPGSTGSGPGRAAGATGDLSVADFPPPWLAGPFLVDTWDPAGSTACAICQALANRLSIQGDPAARAPDLQGPSPGPKALLELQDRLTETASGVLCLPHLERWLAQAASGSDATVRTAARRAGQLAEDLAGFINKQRWDVATPLTTAERASVRAAPAFLGGECVVLKVGSDGP